MDANVLTNKYAAMNQGGIDKLLSDQFERWQGLPIKDALNLVLALHFKPNRALDDVMTTLTEAASNCGIELCLAGRDYPLHVTIQQGAVNNLSRPLSNLAEPFALVLGATFTFEQVIAGPNILLASSLVPQVVTDCRVAVSNIMTDSGVAPAPISILHATAARIMKVSDVNSLPDFVWLVSNLRTRVKSCPIELTVSHLSFGTVVELLQKPVAA